MKLQNGILLIVGAVLLCTMPATAHTKKQPASQQAFRPRVFINPGHGGHDSNDRPMTAYNEGTGQRETYYESDSNLNEGIALGDILRSKGYEVFMSRVNNTSNDDLLLFEISQLALNSGADVFFAVHSNSTGSSKRINFPVGLFRGYNSRAAVEGSDELAEIVAHNTRANQASCWSGGAMVRGDWSFYNWGYGVGLGVLRWNKVPGLLIETSFHDYLPERERMYNKDFGRLNAFIHSNSLDKFFNRQGYDRGMIAGVVRYDIARRGGRVTTFGDDRYQPVNDYPVELCNAKGKVIASYQIDEMNNGFYLFSDLPPGNYTIEIDGSESHPITVKANEVSYCNVMLKAPAKELESDPNAGENTDNETIQSAEEFNQ